MLNIFKYNSMFDINTNQLPQCTCQLILPHNENKLCYVYNETLASKQETE